MSLEDRMWKRRIIPIMQTKEDEMTSDDEGHDCWLENAVAGNSVGKSEVELRAQRAYYLEGLVTALDVDVAEDLTALRAMDVENIDPDRHVETVTALLEADEFLTGMLLKIDEIKRLVAKPPNTRRQFEIGRRKRTIKDKKRRSVRG